jgi:hypothetical protein
MAPVQYPKMLTTTVGTRTVPLRWPDSHPKGGTIIIFANADEEAAYGGGGIPVTDFEHPKVDSRSGKEKN